MNKLKTAMALAGAALAIYGWNRYKSDPPPRTQVVFNGMAQGAATFHPAKRPAHMQGLWRIRAGTWEVGEGGHHIFLEFSPADPARGGPHDIFQIQGIAVDTVENRTTGLDFMKPAFLWRYFIGDEVLKVTSENNDFNKTFFKKRPDHLVDVFYGTRDEVIKMYLDALALACRINSRNYGYEIINRNSNSAARTLLQGLGLGVPSVFCSTPESIGNDRCVWTPAIGENLLPRDWDRAAARRNGGYAGLTGEALFRYAVAHPVSLGQVLKPRMAAPAPAFSKPV